MFPREYRNMKEDVRKSSLTTPYPGQPVEVLVMKCLVCPIWFTQGEEEHQYVLSH